MTYNGQTTEEITIVRHATGWRVDFGRVPKSRLTFYAPGLHIFVYGSGTTKEYDTLSNIAMNECLERHIPIAALKPALTLKKPNAKPEATDSNGRAQKPLLAPDPGWEEVISQNQKTVERMMEVAPAYTCDYCGEEIETPLSVCKNCGVSGSG